MRIELETLINATIERCFDLARSIDLHMASTNQTGEQAVGGVVTGLIGPGETVTWRGRHFGFMLEHTSRITAFDFPKHFQDEMVRGIFKRFRHDHHFEAQRGGTLMSETLEFEAPCGFLGRIVEKAVLAEHLRLLLEKRNGCIKRVAESEDWKKYIPSTGPL